jgi:predicted phage terminase large subunit-like protein
MSAAIAQQIANLAYATRLEWPDTMAQEASGGQWVSHPWIRKVAEVTWDGIMRGNARILLSAPPQHGKSEFCSNWLPTCFLRKFPRKKVILGTYGQDYANKWGAKVRENLTLNPRIRIPMRLDTASKKKFMTSEGGQMMVAGVDGPATGEGADLFIVDDPYKNPEEAMSTDIRMKVMQWFRAVANTRLQSGGSVIVMHTRWMDDDLIGELSREGGWICLNFEAVCEHPELDPIGRKLGEALCPPRYTAEDLAQKRIDVTDLFWFPMYQGTPLNTAGAIVLETDIQYYDALPELEEKAIFADLTYEKDEENDFAVFEVWGRRGANIYLVDQIRARMGLPEQLDAFARIIAAHPTAYHKEIEEKANGAAVISLVKDKIPGIASNKPQTSKGARLAAVSPLYKTKNMWYPRAATHPWVKNNVYEVTRMTLAGSKASHDDTVDTATMAGAYFGRMNSSLQKLAALVRR